MTPVILLSDGALGNGSEVFRIPRMADMPTITPRLAKANDPDYRPYRRDEKTLAREWAIPGTEGLRHRVGGLEKENVVGNLSTNPENHQIMTELREERSTALPMTFRCRKSMATRTLTSSSSAGAALSVLSVPLSKR